MSADDARSPTPTTTHSQAIVEFLEGEGVKYKLIDHKPTISAAAEARATHYPPDQVAKTIVLHDGSGYVIAAIPASDRLDLHKLRQVLGGTWALRLAREDEIAREFPTLEIGALPPFGPIVAAAEVIDRALLEAPRILCHAGDHRHSVLVDPRDVVRMTAATIADICQD
jgi:Ala-tRNA(Pro) deacylase